MILKIQLSFGQLSTLHVYGMAIHIVFDVNTPKNVYHLF